MSLLESKERVSEINFDFFVWPDDAAVGKGWLVAANNNEGNSFVLFEFFKLVQIALRLFLNLFLG